MKRTLITLAVATILIFAPMNLYGKTIPTIEEQVRREILMLPYYQIFDRIDFTVENGTVTLSGVVTRPVLKSSAEKILAKIDHHHALILRERIIINLARKQFIRFFILHGEKIISAPPRIFDSHKNPSQLITVQG